MAIVMLAITGCASSGYTAEPLFPKNVRTVALSILANRTFYRGVEFDLSEALAKEIELRTPYKIASHASADTLISGTVSSLNQNVLSRTNVAGMPQEVQVTITAGFEWKDQRSGEVLRKRARVVGTGQYIPTMTVSEPFEIAQHRAVEELAREMVSIMASDW
jgi:hypothetical protein